MVCYVHMGATKVLIRSRDTENIRMETEASATVKVDEEGRIYLPAQTRKALSIYKQEAHLDLDIRVIEQSDDSTNSHPVESD